MTEGVQPRVGNGFIPAHGGYEDLLSYHRSVLVYDGTVRFDGILQAMVNSELLLSPLTPQGAAG